MAKYEVWLSKDSGERISEISSKVNKIQYAKAVNGFGAFEVDLAMSALKSPDIIQPDRVIEIWRTPEAEAPGKQRLVFYGLTRQWEFTTDSYGREMVAISGVDQNHLLSRRIVREKAGGALATVVNLEADDAMKFVVNSHVASPSITDRITPNTSVQAYTGLGPKIDKAFAYKNVLLVLQEMAQMTKALGNEIFFELSIEGVAGDFTPSFVFNTFQGQPGRDRSWSAGIYNPIVFSKEWGNLARTSLMYDHSQEKTWVLAAGEGQGSDRRWAEWYDEPAMKQSIYGRIEKFQDARMAKSATELTYASQESLAESRAKLRVVGEIIDAPNSRYGVHWDLGDKITTSIAGQQFDVIVRNVGVKVNNSGLESIQARIETEIYL